MLLSEFVISVQSLFLSSGPCGNEDCVFDCGQCKDFEKRLNETYQAVLTKLIQIVPADQVAKVTTRCFYLSDETYRGEGPDWLRQKAVELLYEKLNDQQKTEMEEFWSALIKW